MVVNDQNTDLNHWKERLPHRADVHLLDMDIFQDHLVLSERKDGLKTLRILNFKTQNVHRIIVTLNDYRMTNK